MSKIVFADGDVPLGAMVMVRGMRACVADATVANARALPRPTWLGEKKIRSGQSFAVEMIEGLGSRDLQAIADGPIMDASQLYLPAGKLSMAEARAREAAQILPDNPA
jgi:hypothetical protein